MILLFVQCAQVLPLDGGARDTEAPKLLKSVPENASLNFNSKTIEFVFDEFVQVKDIANQLIVTPSTKELPLVEARGKKVTVKFNEDLIPNTTYRLFFGNAIADMHESNTINNFEYVFSTGNEIDSFSVEGIVRNMVNLKPESNCSIGLYAENDSDSTFINGKPIYFTKSDQEGHYKLSYLPKNKFKAIAFTDKNKNLMYDRGEESVGFSTDGVNTQENKSIDFNLFKEETTKRFVKKAVSPYYGRAIVTFNKEQKNEVRPYYRKDAANIYSLNEENDTCIIYYKDIYDTLRFIIHHPGILDVDTVSVSILSQEKFQKLANESKLIFDIEPKNMNSGMLDYFRPITLKFANWIDPAKIDTTKISLIQKEDSINVVIPIRIKTILGDQLNIEGKVNPGSQYALILKKNALETKIGSKNDSTVFNFKTTEPDDYANLSLKLLFPKKENYIVQIINSDEKLISEQYVELSITSSAEQVFSFKNLYPGNYFVKVIEDKNKNKKWDTGKLLGKIQPETIYFNTLPIKLLANWDSESEWKIK